MQDSVVILAITSIVALIIVFLALARARGFRVLLRILGVLGLDVRAEPEISKKPGRRIQTEIGKEATLDDYKGSIEGVLDAEIETKIQEGGEGRNLRHRIRDRERD